MQFKLPDLTIPGQSGYDPMDIKKQENAKRYIGKEISVIARFLNRDKYGRLHFSYDDKPEISEKLDDINNSVRDYYQLNKQLQTTPETAELHYCHPFDKINHNFNILLSNKDREDLIVFVNLMAYPVKNLPVGIDYKLRLKVRFVDNYQPKTDIYSRGWKFKLIKIEGIE